MSNSRSGSHGASDGKENKQQQQQLLLLKQVRRQRSEASPPPSTSPSCGTPSGGGGWQLPSSSRCLACGRLGALCDCRTTRMDPQLKRQKLDNFLLTTPYERCKQLKALDEVGREEAKHRRRLMEQWGEEVKVLTHTAATQQRVLYLALEESKSREDVKALERKEWAEVMMIVDRHMVLLAITRHEREERLQLYASTQREAQILIDWHNKTFQFLSLNSREFAFRDALLNNEAASRATLKILNVELLNIIDCNEKVRRGIYENYWENREKIILEWFEGLEFIQNSIVDDNKRIQWMMQERKRMFELCIRQKSELESEELKTRRNLNDIMVEEGHYVLEKVRLCERQRESMVQQETRVRNIIIQDVLDTYGRLFIEFKRSEEEARNLEIIKFQKREENIRKAFQFLQSIKEEESLAFTSLKKQEHNEKEQRYQWMLEKEKQYCEMEHFALNQVKILWDEENNTRNALINSMLEEEVGIAAWIQHKTRKMREMVEAAMSQKGEIRLQEHEERFSLVSHKAEQEDAVRRWIDSKEIIRQSIISEEFNYRNIGIELEHNTREEIIWKFSAGLDVCQTLLQQRIESQVKFQQRSLTFIEGIMEQEAAARVLLERVAHDDKERAIQEENLRRVLDILNNETENRGIIVQQEVRYRESIYTHMMLQRNFFAKEAQELLKALICEIVAAEESQRHFIMHLAVESIERLGIEERQSWEEANQCEIKRIREELRKREVALMEDTRLYCEDEELNPNTSNISSQHLQQSSMEQQTEIKEDEIWGLRKQFILGELCSQDNEEEDNIINNEAVSALLTPTSIEFVSYVLDFILKRESQFTMEMQQANNLLSDIQKKVLNQRQLLNNAKERCEESRETIKRDAQEHETRTIMHRNTRQKDEAQLERERARLQAKVEELRKVQTSVSDIREAIHNQYQKR